MRPTTRARSRLRRVRRWSLEEFLVGGLEGMTVDAYGSLRDELIERYSDRLELVDPLWRYEPVPAWLRVLPEPGDLRRVVGGDGRAIADVNAADAARAAVLVGRRHWLADHGYPASGASASATPPRPEGGRR